ncbi:MAG: AAA family ATPase [Desulfitobacteriaceae bacterium]
MNINNICLLNFRCFENTQIKFNNELTIIVGSNGAGKSSVLDAVAIAMGSFIAGIDGIQSNSISKDDVRFVSYELGSVIDRQPQFPVNIQCEANINEEVLTWVRALNSETGKTTIVDAKQIMKYADGLQQNVRKGDRNTILPLVSYYGTGRLFAQKKKKRSSTSLQSATRFTGYIDCLDIMSNEKLMLEWFKKMTLIELQEKRDLPELRAVNGAIKKSLDGVLSENGQTTESNVFYEIKTNDLIITYTDNHGKLMKHPLRELSDGYKNTLSIIADIAYRMAVLNPQLLENVVRLTPGIVLIDEIDLHLHPSWQKRIIKDLRNIFPKVQFILTTHSPSIISSISNEHLIILKDNEAKYPSSSTYGRDVNSVLHEIMGVSDVKSDALNSCASSFSRVSSVRA